MKGFQILSMMLHFHPHAKPFELNTKLLMDVLHQGKFPKKTLKSPVVKKTFEDSAEPHFSFGSPEH